MLRPAALTCLLALAGCAGDEPGTDAVPQHLLVEAHWAGEDATDLAVNVSVHDAGWVSVPCDCTIGVAVDGEDVGQWQATPDDFEETGPGNRTWRKTIPDAATPPCAEGQPFQTLIAWAEVAGAYVTGSAMVACRTE